MQCIHHPDRPATHTQDRGTPRPGLGHWSYCAPCATDRLSPVALFGNALTLAGRYVQTVDGEVAAVLVVTDRDGRYLCTWTTPTGAPINAVPSCDHDVLAVHLADGNWTAQPLATASDPDDLAAWCGLAP